MYVALTLLLMLAFLALCLVGLFALIKQAITDPPFTVPGVFIEDPRPAAAAPSSAARTSAVPSEDAEGSACGEGCA
jgi:hypothetical protein